jgi:predicted transcriptional regulator
VRKTETKGLIEKLFGGSKKALFSALLEDRDMTDEELEELREMIDKR